MDAEPKTLQDAMIYFPDPEICLCYLVARRWPQGVFCPTCGNDAPRFLARRRLWQCRKVHRKRQFSITVGTIFEDSALGLDKWLAAIWMTANCKNGVSSYEVHSALGVTQKSAWLMLHRIRLAMRPGSTNKVGGHVEVDETFIGGKARNMHAQKRHRKIQGRTGMENKVPVMGLLQRGGPVRAVVVKNREKKVLQTEIKKHVEAGSAVYTDTLLSYEGLGGEYAHRVIDHTLAYVDGAIQS